MVELRDEALYRNYGDVSDTSINDLLERVKEIEDKIALVKHYNDAETQLISDIVVSYQTVLFNLANRTIGPVVTHVRQIFPQLLYPDDVVGAGVLRKHRRGSDPKASAMGLLQIFQNVSGLTPVSPSPVSDAPSSSHATPSLIGTLSQKLAGAKKQQ